MSRTTKDLIDMIKSQRKKDERGDLHDQFYDHDDLKKGKMETPAKMAKAIELLTEKVGQLEGDRTKLLKKMERLKRNYEGLSFSTKNEKSEFINLNHENGQLKKEIDALRLNNNELAMREEQYREAVEKLHEQTHDLEEKYNKQMHEHKIQVEETRKQGKKYEEKIKELTTVNNNEKAKRNDEIKRLKSQIKNLEEEASAPHSENLVSEEEINERANAMVEELTKEINVKVQREREDFQNQIDQLKGDLLMAKKVIDQTTEDFEKQKSDLQDKISVGTKTNDQAKEDAIKIQKLETKIIDLKKEVEASNNIIEDKLSILKKKDSEIELLEREKQDKETQIAKLQSGTSQEVKELQETIKNLEDERRKLLLEKGEMERSRDEAQRNLSKNRTELDGIVEQYKNNQDDMENNLRERIKELDDENQMIKSRFEQDIRQERSTNEQITSHNRKIEDRVSFLEKQQSDFKTFKDTIMMTAKKMIKNFEPIESNLSCLSCLEFLEDPLMLICGHSICLKCFKTHSDPQSKDSIVFCEECRVETKNKELMESKVIEIICDKFKSSKRSVNEIMNYANNMRMD